MSAQRLMVYGDPVACCSDACEKPAAVQFRMLIAQDHFECISFCSACWREWRGAYRQAEWDTDVVVRHEE